MDGGTDGWLSGGAALPVAGELGDDVGGVVALSAGLLGEVTTGPPPPPPPPVLPLDPPPPPPDGELLALGDGLCAWAVTPETLELGDGLELELGEADDGEDGEAGGQVGQALRLPSSQSLSTWSVSVPST